MIILFEPQCIGVQHAEVNAAFIEVLIKTFPDENFHFFSESEHGVNVRSHICNKSATKVTFFRINLPNPSLNIKNIIHEFKNINGIFKQISKNNVSYCFILSITSYPDISEIIIPLLRIHGRNRNDSTAFYRC